MAKQKNAVPCPVVIYCGPTIAGVAKQYTVYKGRRRLKRRYPRCPP